MAVCGNGTSYVMEEGSVELQQLTLSITMLTLLEAVEIGHGLSRLHRALPLLELP